MVDHEIVNLPSATSLAVLRQELARREPAPGLVAVLADPVFDQDDNRVKAALTNSASSATKANQSSQSGVAKQRSDGFRKELVASFQDAGQAAEDSETRAGIARLPFTRREAQAILALSRQSESKVALDFDAARASVTSAGLGQYRYLHFATHGLINDKNPELSGLALSLVDGYLRAMDVFNLKLPAELVVLSGCRTGLGKEVRGEGMIGMTRSFMYAGAARVMVSLWNINDRATAELMERFYRELLVKGQSPAAALRAAQIAIWKEKKWREPYYWAAFVLQGEPR
jgi:CHAT domain-containing protein